MFLLSKIITALILPPGSVIAVLLILYILNIKKLYIENRSFCFLYLLAIAMFGLLSIEPFAEKLILPLENVHMEGNQKDKTKKAELIVVLGGGSIIKSGTTIKSELSSITKDRVFEGLIVQKEENIPILFTGGNVLKGKDSPGEAEAVKDIFSRLGINPDDYILENQSRNTYENAVYSSQLTKKRNIILITSAYHMRRSVVCFEKVGFNILETRSVDSRIDDKPRIILDLLPSMNALQNSTTALHEYMGLLYYKLRYEL